MTKPSKQQRKTSLEAGWNKREAELGDRQTSVKNNPNTTATTHNEAAQLKDSGRCGAMTPVDDGIIK